ncbi:MAG: CBS domain-containing protein [Bacteroidia bacterium]|nr:CBS domain-containing protein [Bacteroidia bacterium]
MGEARVKILSRDKIERQHFVQQLLADVHALEYMLKNDWFETGVVRIGAEQEFCLVDQFGKPANKAMEILQDFHPDWLTTELAQFNLEFNLSPYVFEGDAISGLANELRTNFDQVQEAAKRHGTDVVLTGILPTIRKFDLTADNVTPQQRYHALMAALGEMRGAAYEIKFRGIDELLIKHDSPLLEACNTSFQVHLQVEPETFVPMYNIAQALAGPTMAIAANSPMLMGKRLWHETRIVLFQQSIDDRHSYDYQREKSPRVTFGSGWLKKSILDIYKEDISRFRPVLGPEEIEDAFEKIKAGKTPKLKALQVHNGTVYRWNRPCFGINPDGRPHMRIENRILPAGPTLDDEMANTTFWLGAMTGMARLYPDITKFLSFADVRDNFIKSARNGIDCTLNWINDQKVGAAELIQKELIPIAREGLESRNIRKEDIDKYLGIIEERARKHATGARWILKTFTSFNEETTREQALSSMTAAMLKRQQSNKPVHEWDIPKLSENPSPSLGHQLVEECMTTDFCTVQQGDLLELVADMMDWRNVRHMPVEDKDGNLVGLVTSRLLMRHFMRRTKSFGTQAEFVEDIMIDQPLTITPRETLLEAMHIMTKNNIGCLPVVAESKLVGMLSESNLMRMTRRLMMP